MDEYICTVYIIVVIFNVVINWTIELTIGHRDVSFLPFVKYGSLVILFVMFTGSNYLLKCEQVFHQDLRENELK